MVLLTVAATFLSILMAAAFAVDLGLVMVERREVRNAADNAALAAAWADCHSRNAQVAADSSIDRNDYSTTNLTLTKVRRGTFAADVETTVALNFASVVGFGDATVTGMALAECFFHSGSDRSIFAAGDCSGFGKPTLDIPGSVQNIWGGVHSNDNADVGGSSNDFGPGNVQVDPFTYAKSFKDGGGGNTWDAGYPLQTGVEPMPLAFRLRDYSPASGNATDAGALGEYFYVDGEHRRCLHPGSRQRPLLRRRQHRPG